MDHRPKITIWNEDPVNSPTAANIIPISIYAVQYESNTKSLLIHAVDPDTLYLTYSTERSSIQYSGTRSSTPNAIAKVFSQTKPPLLSLSEGIPIYRTLSDVKDIFIHSKQNSRVFLWITTGHRLSGVRQTICNAISSASHNAIHNSPGWRSAHEMCFDFDALQEYA